MRVFFLTLLKRLSKTSQTFERDRENAGMQSHPQSFDVLEEFGTEAESM
jgi:hypothetical protein